ncbi:MAG: hypothetical protein ACTSQG_01465, partial [Promethearchaeota archaeon]
MKEKRKENKVKSGTPNGSDVCTGMVSPNNELVERAELNKLTSAKLYKLLQSKKVCNRSKFRKKAERLDALI